MKKLFLLLSKEKAVLIAALFLSGCIAVKTVDVIIVDVNDSLKPAEKPKSN